MSASAIRVDKIASVAYRLGFGEEVPVLAEARAARPGDCVVVRARTEKRIYNELELDTGRMARIFRGDTIVGALGSRRALRGFVGGVPERAAPGDVLSILNLGGVIGKAAGPHLDLGPACEVEIIGWVADGARILNVADSRIPAWPGGTLAPRPPIVLVSGTSMGSGKTRACCEIIHQLAHGGRRIHAGKLTGVACLRDCLGMEDHGARRTASFLDAGHPSTVDLAEVVREAAAIIAFLSNGDPDAIVLELGDGLLGDYGVREILRDREIQSVARAHVLCASDIVGAWGARELLDEWGLPIDIVAGPVTDNEAGRAPVERDLGLPAVNAPASPERLSALVAEKLWGTER
ncbi:MAG: hypothetical protein JXP34_07655 [Planctomycetes bacterium]|nr:hypothetical protein [Planctomycetota bacterium]